LSLKTSEKLARIFKRPILQTKFYTPPLYESRRRYIMAIKEPDGIDKAVDEIMKDNFFLDKKDREEIREKFINDMEEFKKDFESTRELLTTGEET